MSHRAPKNGTNQRCQRKARYSCAIHVPTDDEPMGVDVSIRGIVFNCGDGFQSQEQKNTFLQSSKARPLSSGERGLQHLDADVSPRDDVSVSY